MMGQVDVKTAIKYPASRSGYCAHGDRVKRSRSRRVGAFGYGTRLRHTWKFQVYDECVRDRKAGERGRNRTFNLL